MGTQDVPLEGIVWWNIYGELNPYRECEKDDHEKALGDDYTFESAVIGLTCIQCGIKRPATDQYFDVYSLLCQGGGDAPHFDVPTKYYPLATTSPVCRFCQLSMFSTMRAADDASKYNNRPASIYELVWPTGDHAGQPFYVGQSRDLITRFRQHCLEDLFAYRQNRTPNDKAIVVGNLLEDGIPPFMVAVSTCPKSEGTYHETKRIIELTNMGIPLVNRRAEHTDKFGYAPNALQKQLKKLWDDCFERAVKPD